MPGTADIFTNGFFQIIRKVEITADGDNLLIDDLNAVHTVNTEVRQYLRTLIIA